jgi:hypothetical protein
MQSKLWPLLSSFSSDEWNRFGLFLQSPYWKASENCFKLYQSLHEIYPVFSPVRIAKMKLAESIFGKGAKTEVNFRGLLSDFQKHSLHFLQCECLKNSSGNNFTEILNELMKREQYALLISLLRKEKERVRKLPESEKKFLNNFLLLELEWRHSQVEEIGSLHKLSQHVNASTLCDELCKFFYSELLRLSDFLENHSRIHNLQLNLKKYSEVLNIIDANIELNDPLIHLQKKLHLFRTSPDFEKAIELKNLALQKPRMEESVFNEVMASLSNFYTNEVNRGNEKSYLPALVTLREINNRKSYSFEKIMPDAFFINYIQIALINDGVEEAELFLKKNSSQLKSKTKYNTLSYAKALIAFEKKNYSECLMLANQTKFVTPIRQIGVKNLYLKIYFEKKDFDSANNMIDTYRHVLKNKTRLSEKTKKLHYNFLKIYMKLLKATREKNKKSRLILKKEILDSNYISNKKWLLLHCE